MVDDWIESQEKKQQYRRIFIPEVGCQDEVIYTEKDMIEASKYGYNFHKTTQFPNQEFEDSCIRNTQQWLTNYKNE